MRSYGIFMLVPVTLLLLFISSLEISVADDSVKPCTYDEECKDFEVCHGKKCASACHFRDGIEVISKCGKNALCYMRKRHFASCSCDPGYTGDPEVECFVITDPKGRCVSQGDCQISEACTAGRCIDVCKLRNGNAVMNKCGSNAYCYTSKPHVGACKCAPTHAGDPDEGCNERLSIVHSDPM